MTANAAATPLPSAGIQSALDAYTAGFPGAAVAVAIVDGDATSAYFSGNLGNGRKLDDRTLFQIGSVTKTFTATLFAQMVLAGDVGLHDPIGKYLPPGVHAPSFRGKTMALVNLAEQNSGLPRLPSNLKPADTSDPYADYTPKRLYDFIGSYAPTRAPGQAYEYSNLGVGLLGDLLARRAGIAYPALLQQRVLTPLGMGDTTFAPDAQQRGRLAPGFSAAGKPQPVWTFGDLEAAGGLYSDLHDMIAYVRANLAAPAGPLGPAMAMAQSPRAEDDSHGITRVGFVWLTNVSNSNTFMNGEVGGYHAFVLLNRARRSGLVALANVADFGVDALALHLLYPDTVAAPQPAGQARPAATPAPGEDPAIAARAKAWFHALKTGTVDRSQLTPEFSTYLTPALLKGIAEQLGAVADPTGWTYLGSQAQRGATVFRYQIELAGAMHVFSIAIAPDGKLAGSLLR